MTMRIFHRRAFPVTALLSRLADALDQRNLEPEEERALSAAARLAAEGRNPYRLRIELRDETSPERWWRALLPLDFEIGDGVTYVDEVTGVRVSVGPARDAEKEEEEVPPPST